MSPDSARTRRKAARRRPHFKRRIESESRCNIMRSILHSLAWKEWHEHKWKLVSMVAVLWGTGALAMFEGRRDAFALAGVVMALCIGPFAFFIGLGAAANER